MPDTNEKTFLFNGEQVEYYPEDTVPPFIESPLDSAKYENHDDSLDDVLARNGGHFYMCNANILTAKWSV
jgi:hypothetical protein